MIDYSMIMVPLMSIYGNVWITAMTLICIIWLWTSFLLFEYAKFEKNPEKYWEVALKWREMKLAKNKVPR